jgi:hypothetical protein
LLLVTEMGGGFLLLHFTYVDIVERGTIEYEGVENSILQLKPTSFHTLYEWSVTIGGISVPSFGHFVEYMHFRL